MITLKEDQLILLLGTRFNSFAVFELAIMCIRFAALGGIPPFNVVTCRIGIWLFRSLLECMNCETCPQPSERYEISKFGWYIFDKCKIDPVVKSFRLRWDSNTDRSGAL